MRVAIGCVILFSAACGGDGGKSLDVPPDASSNDVADGGAGQYSITVTVTGLRGDLGVILNSGTEQVLVEDGELVLGGLDTGASYEVSLGSQPGIQACQLSNGSGTVAGADVAVSIACDLLLFTTMTDGENGTEWWKSDGTEAGTVMLRDIGAGELRGAFEPDYAFLPRDYVVFMASDGTNGVQLWKSDGTEAGTTIVKMINENGGAGIDDLVAFAGEVYFVGYNGSDGYELWKTDGTEANTLMVKNIDGGLGNSVVSLKTAVMGGELYFAASTIPGGVALWKTDGTEAGTVLVKNVGFNGSGTTPNSLVVMGDALYFDASGNALGSELWKSDGTEAGTVMVKDINPESPGSFPSVLTVIGSTLYFAASTPGTNGGLWKSDGTEVGTVEVLPVANGGPSGWHSPLVFDGNLYFAAASATDGIELWRSDGSAEGTAVFKDIRPSGDSSSDSVPFDFSLVPGGFVFSAANDSLGRELWRSDGTAQGTVALPEINPGPGSSGTLRWGDKLSFGGSVLYFGNDGTGMEPYLVDFSGATKIKEVNPTGSALLNQ